MKQNQILQIEEGLSQEELIKKYNLLRKKAESIQQKYEWEMHEIIAEAYKIGKKIHGDFFGIRILAMDFSITYSMAKKLLLIRKASKKLKRMIQEEKISVINAATILESPYRRQRQDEIAKIVQEDNLHYHDIRRFNGRRIKNENLNMMRQKLAAEKGYKRMGDAMRSLNRTLQNINNFLIMDYRKMPKKSIQKVIQKFSALKYDLERKIKELKNIK